MLIDLHVRGRKFKRCSQSTWIKREEGSRGQIAGKLEALKVCQDMCDFLLWASLTVRFLKTVSFPFLEMGSVQPRMQYILQVRVSRAMASDGVSLG